MDVGVMLAMEGVDLPFGASVTSLRSRLFPKLLLIKLHDCILCSRPHNIYILCWMYIVYIQLNPHVEIGKYAENTPPWGTLTSPHSDIQHTSQHATFNNLGPHATQTSLRYLYLPESEMQRFLALRYLPQCSKAGALYVPEARA